jgi:hypothetical protein
LDSNLQQQGSGSGSQQHGSGFGLQHPHLGSQHSHPQLFLHPHPPRPNKLKNMFLPPL